MSIVRHPRRRAERLALDFAEQGAAQIAAIRPHFADLAAIRTAPLLSRGEAAGLKGRLRVLWGEADNFFRRASKTLPAPAISSRAPRRTASEPGS